MATKIFNVSNSDFKKKIKHTEKYKVSKSEKSIIEKAIQECKDKSEYDYYKLKNKIFCKSKARPYQIQSGMMHFVSQIIYQSLKGGNEKCSKK